MKARKLPPPIVVEVQPSPRRARLFGRLTAGFCYRWALQQSFIGGSFEGELGARDHRFAAGVGCGSKQAKCSLACRIK